MFLLVPLAHRVLPALLLAVIHLSAGIAGWVPVVTLLARAQVATHYVHTVGVVSTDIWSQAALVLIQAERGHMVKATLALAVTLLAGGVGHAVQGGAAHGLLHVGVTACVAITFIAWLAGTSESWFCVLTIGIDTTGRGQALVYVLAGEGWRFSLVSFLAGAYLYPISPDTVTMVSTVTWQAAGSVWRMSFIPILTRALVPSINVNADSMRTTLKVSTATLIYIFTPPHEPWSIALHTLALIATHSVGTHSLGSTNIRLCCTFINVLTK